ncbi:MAG: M23 family metallopeptidase [Candidatus Vogelbacteria bacterium]|nr:M23 family metallopeptidase [Candidatus Vogelbacteria bacterium]
MGFGRFRVRRLKLKNSENTQIIRLILSIDSKASRSVTSSLKAKIYSLCSPVRENRRFFVFSVLVLVFAVTIPARAFFKLFHEAEAAPSTILRNNSQTLPLLNPEKNPNTIVAMGGGDISVIGGSLLPDDGPLGTIADVIGDYAGSDQISLYTVRAGDSVREIAKTFNVSVNTVLWANNLSRNSKLTEGQVLTILPVTGVRHIVKKGETVSGIAAKYKADPDEILLFNSEVIQDGLSAGDEILVPDGEIVVLTPPKNRVSKDSVKDNPAHDINGPTYNGYYANPLPGGRRTQGLHGYNGVDLASECRCSGAPIKAAAAGTVIVSRQGGWNGGYGNYVVVSHDNGTQTLYSHLLRSSVGVGDRVAQGETVGLLGNTGKSTGPHLHFEVRGARNPF